MANLRDLKAFVRYDGSGRVVAGSLIFRKSKPKVGNFQQINSFKCCNVDQSPVVVDITNSFPIGAASLYLGNNDGNYYQPIYAYTNTTAGDIDELAAIFNSAFKNLGFFNVVDGDLIWTPSVGIADFYASDSTITSLFMNAFSD